ncbi:MAG: PQQ-binding-like beta-propeller repeat protein [Verrucomicrobia bacterium]|nr:PQQ-binding-like beta-propeller repeat protein [Verrucomicrobiota bacterium]
MARPGTGSLPKTGELVWSSTPGTPPKDSSFSSPVLGWLDGHRVLYAGTGCGNLVCVEARTGQPLWRFHLSLAGVNSSVLIHDNNKLIAIHEGENLDASEVGRMVAIKLGPVPPADAKEPVVLDHSYELWRQPLAMFTSSPVLAGDWIFQVTRTGELVCLDANSGEILWLKKLANSQLHASPLFAEGRLYVPMENGTLYILKPSATGAEILDEEKLEGDCLGAPTAWNGKLYLHTKSKLYCWGKPGNNPGLAHWPKPDAGPAPGKATTLQLIPSDLLLAPGDEHALRVRQLDSKGLTVNTTGADQLDAFEPFIPPTAKVKSKMNASLQHGALRADKEVVPSAGAFKATQDGLTGFVRGRVLPSVPFTEDFESFEIVETQPEGHIEAGARFAYPPLPWIGARFKWEIREQDGNKVLRKTLDNVLFQRAITFIGPDNLSAYTIEADVMTEGNRRTKSNVGVINQRYFITLVGNAQILEVSSNHDRLKVSVPFRWKENVWYTLKSRVDVAPDGSGMIRAKAWPTGEPEPDAWTIEVPHRAANRQGAPGLFGFSPQSLFPVYVDNVRITANDQP